MQEYMFVFRRDLARESEQLAPDKMQALWKAWQDWTGSVAAQNKLGGVGKRLGTEGKVITPDALVTNGPYVELKESVIGYMFVKAASFDDAVALTQGCPNLAMGGSIEIRPVVAENYSR